MPIGRNLLWSITNNGNCLLEKLLSGIQISLLAQSRINQIAISINGPLERAPLSMNLDGRLIHLPGSPGLTSSFSPPLVRNQGRKTFFPVAASLMCKHKAAFQKHLSHITQAQLVA